MTRRIAMWSGPRNLSTAMMRSFGNRSDTFVSDEPFYGCFLRDTGAEHPMREKVVAAMDCDWRTVIAMLSGDPPDASPIWYQKHMWHEMTGPIGFDDFTGFTHAFLIREPERMIASYLKMRQEARIEDLGLKQQAEFFERECDRLGHSPPVVDATDVLADPRDVLAGLCAALDIAWDEAMLHWPAGRRDTDGAWAPHWYKSVEASTGFSPPDSGRVDLPAEARRLADRCRPFYDQLAIHRITRHRQTDSIRQ